MRFLLLFVFLFLQGCTAVGFVTSIGGWAADGIVEAKTGKNIPDNLASSVTKKNCKLKNIFKKEKVCKSNHIPEVKIGG